MSKYIMRLDDACPRHDRQRWQRMEDMLIAYGVRPIVGIIPSCKDPMMDRYPEDPQFWDRARDWQARGWVIALHGYDHVYLTRDGGINPVQQRSEFAGLSLEEQKEKISAGLAVFKEQGLEAKAFFAPSHTFDMDTVKALKEASDIRIISDTIADGPYMKEGITFVPQQSGRVRELPFQYVTFCYHPNTTDEESFHELEGFLRQHEGDFVDFPTEPAQRREGLKDMALRKMYFGGRALRKHINGK